VTLHSLYDLAVHPEYAPILREEIETLVKSEGWSKTTLEKMYKLDSFIKESLRIHVFANSNDAPSNFINKLVSSPRKVLQPFTFSDGITVPKGITLVAPVLPIHMDSSVYENPTEFDGLRFFNLRVNGVASAKAHCVTTSVEFLNFGAGKHSW
jgi:cytochrome P450